jgi:hypothetical protein
MTRMAIAYRVPAGETYVDACVDEGSVVRALDGQNVRVGDDPKHHIDELQQGSIKGP